MVRRAIRGREEARRSRLISPPLDVGATKQPRRAKNRLSERRLTDGYPWSLVHRAGASDQLRDPAGLESALARPAMYAHYQEADLAMQAAILAHAVAEGQYFVEGNKRTAAAACLTFLRVNGHASTASQQELATWVLELSEGRLVEEQLAQHLRFSLDPPLTGST